MQKIILILSLITLLYSKTTYIENSQCSDDYNNSVYYLKQSKNTKNSDMKDRFIDISSKFHNNYIKCVKNIKSQRILK
jgi:hypothetical protein